MRSNSEPDNSQPEEAKAGLLWLIENALGKSPDVNISNLQIRLIGGAVLLMGTINTLREKNTASEIAKSIPGVVEVENDLVIVDNCERSDEELFEAVDMALGNYPPDNPTSIGVRMVENGVAYISGKALSDMETRTAEEIASRVPGIKKVVNEIGVAPGIPLDDVDVKNVVEDALAADPRVDRLAVEVCVDHRNVYLDGEVDDEDSIDAAYEAADSAPGVKQVINRLRVRES